MVIIDCVCIDLTKGQIFPLKEYWVKKPNNMIFDYIMAHILIFPEIVDPNQFTHLIHSFEQAYISMIQNEAEHRAVGQP